GAEQETNLNKNLGRARREAEARQIEKEREAKSKLVSPQKTPTKSLGQKVKGMFNKKRVAPAEN
ncbi:MAG: hypothetical protein ABI041_03535, partial [Bdellovibrionia bacterium]